MKRLLTQPSVLVTLSPTTYYGGADSISYSIYYALKSLGYDVYPYHIEGSNYARSTMFSHSTMFLSAEITNMMSKTIDKMLQRTEKIIAISTFPQYTYHLLKLKGRYNNKLIVLWRPGGNDFLCPLHNEVCPYSPQEIAYGFSTSPQFFLTKCIWHMLKIRKFSLYSTLIWPSLRILAKQRLDGLLASRSIYIEGCKRIGYERCFYIGFGIDTARFKPRDKAIIIEHLVNSNILNSVKSNILLGELRTFIIDVHDPNTMVFGFIGSTRPRWKNVELLIKVFAQLKKIEQQLVGERKLNLKLIIIARDADLLVPSIHQYSSYLEDSILVIRRIPHQYIHYFYNLIDIFVNPSLLDSLEVNTLEALASGNIVLASNRGSIKDLERLGIKVIRFEPREKELVQTIINLVNDLDKIRKIYKNNLNIFKKAFDLNAFAKRLDRALQELVS
ncbi:MAG: glycosyltransferase family 4 protein [Thermoproteus sp.]